MKIRGRPKKYRIVRQDIKVSHFSPRGRPGRPDEANLSMDEYEAIRLIDFMGLSQKEAANSMRISQQTLSRVLRRARKIVAQGLVDAMTIRIQGGSYVISSKKPDLYQPAQGKLQGSGLTDNYIATYLNLA